jgi:ABC-type polysaccharide/polyol phosphate export permease
MVGYLSAIWSCRYFWLSLVKMDLRTRYRGSVLGLGWSLLQPLAMTVILCAVFRRIFQTNIVEYAPLLLTGLAFWSFFMSVVQTGCNCFHIAEPYIRQYPAPLAIYPIRSTLGAAFHFFVALVLVLMLTALFKWSLPSATALLALVPGILLLLVFVWAITVLLGLAQVHFPDSKHLAEVGFQALFYLTPIMYPATMLDGGRLGLILRCNPLSFFLQLLREPILHDQLASPSMYAGALLTVLVAVAGAAYALSRLERRFIFHL